MARYMTPHKAQFQSPSSFKVVENGNRISQAYSIFISPVRLLRFAFVYFLYGNQFVSKLRVERNHYY